MANTTYDFEMMLSSAREAYGEELYKMAKEGIDFVFTYTDNVAPYGESLGIAGKARNPGLTQTPHNYENLRRGHELPTTQ